MYNDLVKRLLADIKKEDGCILPGQQKYVVSDNFSTVEIYVLENKVSFRVSGDAYILSMVKWLQLKIQNQEDIKNISLESLVDTFDLPEIKYRNALQIVQLIERINAGSAI